MYRKDELMKKFSKSLGNTEARLLSSLAAQGKTVFTLPEAQETAGVSDYHIDFNPALRCFDKPFYKAFVRQTVQFKGN